MQYANEMSLYRVTNVDGETWEGYATNSSYALSYAEIDFERRGLTQFSITEVRRLKTGRKS